MRVEFHPGKLRKACERPLPVVHAALDLAVAGPEKIFPGKQRACLPKLLHDEIRQGNIDRNFCFCRIEEELIVFDFVIAEERYVSDPKAGVPEREDKGSYPGPVSFAVNSVRRIKVARPKDFLEIFVRDGKRGAIVPDRRLDTFRRV